MTPAEFERLEQLLAALEPEIKDMNSRSQDFVRDQLARVQQYGGQVRMSPKQMAWLDSLYEKHVGPLDGLGSGHHDGRDNTAARGEVLGDDMDDDDTIPF